MAPEQGRCRLRRAPIQRRPVPAVHRRHPGAAPLSVRPADCRQRPAAWLPRARSSVQRLQLESGRAGCRQMGHPAGLGRRPAIRKRSARAVSRRTSRPDNIVDATERVSERMPSRRCLGPMSRCCGGSASAAACCNASLFPWAERDLVRGRNRLAQARPEGQSRLQSSASALDFLPKVLKRDMDSGEEFANRFVAATDQPEQEMLGLDRLGCGRSAARRWPTPCRRPNGRRRRGGRCRGRWRRARRAGSPRRDASR